MTSVVCDQSWEASVLQLTNIAICNKMANVRCISTRC